MRGRKPNLPPPSDFGATSRHGNRIFTMNTRLLKIAQQLQCWVREASDRLSPLGTKEMFCHPWRDFMDGVHLPCAERVGMRFPLSRFPAFRFYPHLNACVWNSTDFPTLENPIFNGHKRT